MKKFIALLLTAVVSTASFIPAYAGEELTKGEFAQKLLTAAQDYNEGVEIGDFFKGNGSYDTSNAPITKVEALAMISRAFGTLPALRGDLLRTAPQEADYTDLPQWSTGDISRLSKAGVLSEPSGELGSNEYIDDDYADTMFARMYRLFGTNYKDDFYSYINYDFLRDGEIAPGLSEASVFQDMNDVIGYELVDMLSDIVAQEQPEGSPQQKIRDFYLTAADEETRNELGAEPIMPYLEKLRAVDTDKELMTFALNMAKETTIDILAGYSMAVDYADSSRYLPVLDSYSITLQKDEYTDKDRLDACRDVMVTFFTLGGNDEKTALEKANSVLDFETELAKHTRAEDEYTDIEDAYNYYTLDELQSLFGTLDLQAIADLHGIDVSGDIVVADPDALKYYAALFDGKHTQLLKNLSEISLLAIYSTMLDSDFMEAYDDLTELVNGYDPQTDITSDAFNTTATVMSSFLGRIYYENNMTPEKEEAVRNIAQSIIDVYKSRISQQDWLSEETKAEAVKKLDNMDIIIGMKEGAADPLDEIDIKGIAEGGTYIDNVYAIFRENDKLTAALSQGDMDFDEIDFSPYLVNASYYPMSNTFVLPAGILNEPVFSLEASDSWNYGALGCIIGHEISHAFDTNGAKFDENGDYDDWWKPEDYSAFEKLSQRVVDYYDGAEVATGMEINGEYTLDENIADIGGMRCALDALKKVDADPDYEEFFISYATIFRSSANRLVLGAYLVGDNHSPSNVRVNYTLRCMDEFYDTFDINEGDGMYLSEEDRVGIW